MKIVEIQGDVDALGIGNVNKIVTENHKARDHLVHRQELFNRHSGSIKACNVLTS
jgi:hypothetical protein